MAGVPIACRDLLYRSFCDSLASADGLSVFKERTKALALGHPADAEYLRDRLARFERVLKRWPRIRSVTPALDRDLRLGAALFDEGLFFDCHEYLEGAWRRAESGGKIMIQGLIQAAAGFHKLELGSPEGCAELLGKAAEKLSNVRDPRERSLRALAARLEQAGRDVLSGAFDPRRVPKLGTIFT